MEILSQTTAHSPEEIHQFLVDAIVRASQDDSRSILQLLVEPTHYVLNINGIQYRIWRGATPTGQPAYMLVNMIASPDSNLQSILGEFLSECRSPEENLPPPQGDPEAN
jgi:hypothetical protein